ncbi:HIT family protein [Candidatus Pacearchaeota archaeon]|nr:HIT family protein [Candidatus Pacearchaeota archaeon]
MLTEEQAEGIKKQLIQQINSWNTEENKKQEVISQVEEMSAEELEEFLSKNNLMKNTGEDKQDCPFCLITEGKIPAYKIAETKNAIAVLEINPISKGHIIILPKSHSSDESNVSEINIIKKEFEEKIKQVLNPKKIEKSSFNISGHSAINVVPIYENEKLERKKADKTQLEEMQKKIFIGEIKEKKEEIKPPIKEEIKESKEAKKSEEVLEKAPRRIP